MAGRSYRSERDSHVSPWIKWIMFAFNLVFWVLSLVLIAVGVWAYVLTQEFKDNMGVSQDDPKNIFDYLFDFALLFIVLGIVIFILSFLGLLGALRENVCMLKTFSISLGVVFLLELALVITVLAMASSAQETLENVLKEEAIKDYRGSDINKRNVIDWFQETFECCGVGDEGYKSWEANKYFSCDSPGFEACSVPYSCCKEEFRYQYDSMTAFTRCGHGVLDDKNTKSDVSPRIFVRGCVGAAIAVAKDNIFIIGGVALAIVLPQIIGIALSWILARQVIDQRNRKY